MRLNQPSFLLLLSSLLSAPSFAAETDDFTSRYQALSDGLPAINAEVQRRIDSGIQELNSQSKRTKTCDWKEMASVMGSQLRQPFLGQIEHFIDTDPSVPKIKIELADSIYKNMPVLTYGPIKLGTWLGIGFASHIHHDGLVIGADKFGHFMDEGYYYYSYVHTWNHTPKEAVDFGFLLENTFDGRWTSGIISYADMSANLDGYHFWRNLLGVPKLNEPSQYVSCNLGVWKVQSPVDLALYVNPAWDEGMNCNEFRSHDLFDAMEKEIEKLEARDQKRYRCPVFPERVPEMIRHYGPEGEAIFRRFESKNDVSQIK